MCHNAGVTGNISDREDELAWRERMLDEKEHELNKIEETLAECSLSAAVETIQKGLEYVQTQVKQMSENIEAERSKLQRAIRIMRLTPSIWR